MVPKSVLHLFLAGQSGTAKSARTGRPQDADTAKAFVGAVLGLSVLLLPAAGRAVELEPERPVSLSGFGTAGLTHNDTSGAEFIRDIVQPRGVADGWSGKVDSRIGIQVNARPTESLEGVVQVVSSYRYDGSYDPELTWAYLSYEPDPGLKARVGRLGRDVYLLSDSRNIGYSYLWVRPPVDYFGLLQIAYVDGADVVFRHRLGAGLAGVKLYGGRADQKFPSVQGDIYDLDGTRVYGANLDYWQGPWQFRAGYTSVRVGDNELPAFAPLLEALRNTGNPTAAVLADDLAFAGKTIEIVSAGAVLDHGPWQAQLMFNRLTSTSLVSPQRDSGYFLLGYRSGRWTPYLTLSGTESKMPQWDSGLPTPNPLDTAVAATLAATQSRQTTRSLGLRYDFMRSADLKVQVDQVRVSDNATLLWRNVQPGWDGRATVFSVALDFVF